MKIQSYLNIQPLFGKVAEAGSEKQGGAGQNAYERQKNKDDQEEQKKLLETPEALEAAVDGFSGDETNLAHGISASAEGSGPGLRVVLKDQQGGILRSVSGEEFLRLREAVSSGRKSGRILDQKA
jgi:hypothetical protein